MELSKQVVSFEIAEKLKKLGVKQESYFFWKLGIKDIHGHYFEYVNPRLISEKDFDAHIPREAYVLTSAFTIAELGELFGENFFIAFENLPFDRVSAVIYGAEGKTKGKIKNPRINCKTEVEARAKALIYLIKNKLINPKESPCN